MRGPRLIIIALIAIVVSGIAVAWWMQGTSGPLAGELIHDFGIVPYEPGKPARLKHHFRLTNRTDETLHFVAARPECSCVSTREASPAAIYPGQVFELPITMELQKSFKEVIIYLQFEDGREQQLRVKAQGEVSNTAPPETRPASPAISPPASRPATSPQQSPSSESVPAGR